MGGRSAEVERGLVKHGNQSGRLIALRAHPPTPTCAAVVLGKPVNDHDSTVQKGGFRHITGSAPAMLLTVASSRVA